MIKNTSPVFNRYLLRPLTLSVALLSLSACGVSPERITLDEQVLQANADHQAMFAKQEPIEGAISLDEAMARAIKYNLNQRLALMEQALASNQLDVANLSMLPKLAASAGWNHRSNVSASSSESIRTGTESLEPSTSQERNIRTADLQLSWNILDFGLSYFSAKAQANRALGFEEKRRYIVADIMQKVRQAYWNAATAQRLQPQVKSALEEAQKALAQARQTEEQRLLTPLASLQYQKELLTMVRQLETLDAELATAKSRLAALMNLAPGTPYRLQVASAQQWQVPDLNFRLTQLEQLAMIKRPEIREEAYKARNAVLETRSALLKLLPGATLFSGLNYNSNDYLVNNDWADAGVKVSWNLLNVFSFPSMKRTGEAREQVAHLRRQALRMTVLTQVNVAWRQFQSASHLFDRSQELQQVQSRILKQTDNALQSQAQSRLERVRANTETVLATRQRDRSYADLRTAYGAIYQAAGLDAVPLYVRDDKISTLTDAIRQERQVLAKGDLSEIGIMLAGAHVMMPDRTTQPHTVNLDLWQNLGSLQSVPLTSLDQASQ